MPSSLRRPLAWFLLGVVAFAALLAAFWLRQGPTGSEGALIRPLTADMEQGCRSVGGLAWWTPSYLGGQSLAPLWSTVGNAVPLEIGRAFFGPLAGYKIVGLLALVASGVTMFLFVADFTGSAWAAAWAGAFYVLCPEYAIRLAGVEHFVTACSFPFAPLVFLFMRRLRSEPPARRPRNTLLLAASFSAMFLTWTKAATLFLPAMFFYAAWLWFSAPKGAARRDFARACGVAGAASVVLGGLPLFPTLREQRWMALFDPNALDAWRHYYVLKSGFSFWDRGGAILQAAPAAYHASGDAFYFGLVWGAALALVLFEAGALRAAGWLRTPTGAACRFFLGATLFFTWISYGNDSAWAAHRQLLAHSEALPAWAPAAMWLALLAQGAAAGRLAAIALPRWPRRAGAAGALAYLFLPGFAFVDKLPAFSQLRAPSAVWNVGGSFCLAVAGALALHGVWTHLVPERRRTLAGFAALALLALDLSAYHASFAAPGLDPGTYPDFLRSARFMQAWNEPGGVFAVTDNHIYMELPQRTGRPLFTEMGTEFYQMKETRALADAGKRTPEAFAQLMAAGGVRFLLIDKESAPASGPFASYLRSHYTTVDENAHYAVLRVPQAWAPAVAASSVALQETVDPNEALRALAKGVWTIGAGAEGDVPQSGGATASDQPATVLPLLQPRMSDFHVIRVAPAPAGQPWIVVPESYHPDWTAEADGKPIPVYRALGCYLAARVPHDGAAVTFRFCPPWWYDGALAASAVAWLAAGAVFVVLRRRERAALAS